MRILFVLKNENFMAPNGLCVVSAVLKKQGHKVDLCEVGSDDAFVKIKTNRPDVVAYSSSTGEAKHYLKINERIKKEFPGIFTIMGGPHPTFYPRVVYEGGLDAVCAGEGEYAFLDLLDTVAAGGNLDNIPNIVTKENCESFGIRSTIEDIDSLPFPDYSLIYDSTPLGRYPLKSIITGRGCPYDCSYCFNRRWRQLYAGKGKVVRKHSVDYVLDEISFVRGNWPLSFVKFYDDIFSYDAGSWLEEFSRKYKKRIGLPFFILTRADLISEDMVKLLKNAGCHTISMSIEAGNEEIRDKMLNRQMSNKQIIAAHRLCDKYKIHTFTNCIIGLPETSIKNDLESIDLAVKCRVAWAEFPVFFPFPGTELGDYTVEKGYYDPDYKRLHTSYQYSSPLNCFSRSQKNRLMNITTLGPVAIVFPRCQNIIVNFLISMRHNCLFTFIYYLVKMYTFRKKIYVTKTNFFVSFAIFIRSLRQEWFRHENQKG